MPVDLALFRSSDGILEEVERWQDVRYENARDKETKKLLTNLRDWCLEQRSLLGQVHDARKRLNSLQRSLRPHDMSEKMCMNSIKMEMKELKSKVIPELDGKSRKVASRIERSLPRVANYVDTDISVGDGAVEQTCQVQNSKAKSKWSQDMVLDPLFCIGGYENVHVAGTAGPRIAVLTGIGVALARALAEYSISFLMKKSFPDGCNLSYQLINLPDSVSIPPALAHSLLGCPPRGCRVCSIMDAAKRNEATEESSDSNLVKAPPLVAFSMLHGNKTYWDRQLPQAFLCTTKRCSTDVQDTARLAATTSSNCNKNKRSSWIDRTHELDGTDIFCLAVCNLVETRRIQTSIVHQIMAVLRSMLLDCTKFSMLHRQTGQSSTDSLVRSRLVPPSLLLPNEASRIVIEGYLPSTGDYMTLGHVSNFMDYLSRGCKTKCGGMEVDYVYTVHGRLLSVAETMEWVVQNNVVQVETDEVGVGLHMNLVPFLQLGVGFHACKQQKGTSHIDGSFLFVPCKRRLLRNKKGKVILKEVISALEPRIVHSTDEHRKSRNVTTTAVDSAETPKGLSNCDAGREKPYCPPTRDDAVEAEVLCNPYSFLPVGR